MMAGMSEYRKARFWIQALVITAGTFAGVVINERMGGHWSTWHRFAVRLACSAFAVGIIVLGGIVSHLPAFRRVLRLS
jgi:cytochrome b subunit of formate dehydrogenase